MKKQGKKSNTASLPEIQLPPDKPGIDEAEIIYFHDVHLSKRYADVLQEIVPNEIDHLRREGSRFEFTSRNGVVLRVQWVLPNVARLRYSADGVFERDFSYGIAPDFKPKPVRVTLRETPTEYLLVSEQLQVVVAKTDMRVRFYDRDDHLLREDEAGYTAQRTIMQGWNQVRITQKCQRKDVFYGLGDKSGALNLHGQIFENWCTDSFGYSPTTDPLYRAVPFFYGLTNGAAYGIFLDNTYKTHFDFNSKKTDTVSFWADGGEMNYYFIAADALVGVARTFAQLTGTHELPPMWALGYHQCRWSYYPESHVREICNNFRKLSIPCDAIYLDIDYMDGFRCFTWDKKHFPDLKGMVDDLREQGFETVVMIDPGLKEDVTYPVYLDCVQNGYAVRTADGAVAKAPVWPGFCAFPDYTDPRTRDWWGEQYRELYNELGISGFWNDMNEPAVFYVNHKTLPDQVMHHYDGHPCSHRKAHNVYGQQMTRASWEGLRALQPDKRPFLLARATYAGGQRYAALWTGDNVASWEHLTIANLQCQRLSVSGFSFCGTDIGGFSGDPDGELYVRWLQLSVFHPLMRTHTMGGHATGDAPTAVEGETEVVIPTVRLSEQEPWSFGEKWTPHARKAIELRYRLLPIIYTALWQNVQDGTPALRHLAFEDENDIRLREHERDFLFGEHLLISPVVQPKVQRQLVYLPKGLWYYFWTGSPASGETYINLKYDEIPFFVRAGAVMPTYPLRQWTGEKVVDELTLYVYYKNGTERSLLYEDAGEGYRYQQGEYCLTTFQTEGTVDGFVLQRAVEGNWQLTYTQVKIYLVGFPVFAKKCIVDGQEMPIREIRLRDRSLYTLNVGSTFNKIIWSV